MVEYVLQASSDGQHAEKGTVVMPQSLYPTQDSERKAQPPVVLFVVSCEGIEYTPKEKLKTQTTMMGVKMTNRT